MITIWKYVLLHPSWSGSFNIPKGAKFIHFDFQHRNPTIWFEVNTDAQKESREFEIIGTGFEIPLDARYLASCQVVDVNYWAWHLFEVIH